MKKILILFLSIALLESCASVEKYNNSITVLRNEEKLKSDVDYLYKRLQKLHPRLDWYISKKDLDYKFDSLKSVISAPMTSNDFYLKLSPVVASIKQGHLRVYQLNKKTDDKSSPLNPESFPLSRFDFERFANKLYIVKNNSEYDSIKPGTELVSVNNVSPGELIAKYIHTFSSDGFNKTFISRRSGRDFPNFFYYQNGLTDSVLCELKFNDTLKTVCLKPQKANAPSKKGNTPEPTKINKEQHKKEVEKRDEQGYDVKRKMYSKNLSFIDPDSSIAVLKVIDFSNGRYKRFYSNAFKRLDSLGTKSLILDLRDNPGGNLQDAMDLYSYLADSDFVFIDRSEVTSRSSILHTSYFKGNTLFIKAILLVFVPLKLVSMGMTMSKVEKEGKRYYFPFPGTGITHPKPNRFKGRLYVLINGGSFSAACILSSNLKGSGRAVFVGEETGGAFNGTVAGKMTSLTLPESGLRTTFGLALIKTYYRSVREGRGILPDIRVKPTLEDRITGKDPELNCALDDIRNGQK